MTDTFVPPVAPGFPSKMTTTSRVLQADFGDGHVQMAQDGLNADTVTWELNWPGLSLEDAGEIMAFMSAQGSWKSFYYTMAGDIQRKYRRGPVTMSYDNSGVVVSMSVTLTESHD